MWKYCIIFALCLTKNTKMSEKTWKFREIFDIVDGYFLNSSMVTQEERETYIDDIMTQFVPDAEDDPDYQIITDYEDIISNAPECVTRYYRELPLKSQLQFIEMNPEADCDGSFHYPEGIILEQVQQSLLNKKGNPTSHKCITLILSIDEYMINYTKWGFLISSEVFDCEEDADEAFAALAKDHPECKPHKL